MLVIYRILRCIYSSFKISQYIPFQSIGSRTAASKEVLLNGGTGPNKIGKRTNKLEQQQQQKLNNKQERKQWKASTITSDVIWMGSCWIMPNKC